MGSTGTGNFSDYSENQKENKGENSSGSHETGGRSGSDKCLRAFTTKLEEVANSDYLAQNGTLPPAGSNIIIRFNQRIEAATEDGLGLGYLPTSFNYLLGCIENGHSYSGVITSSNLTPLPSLSIDVHPE